VQQQRTIAGRFERHSLSLILAARGISRDAFFTVRREANTMKFPDFYRIGFARDALYKRISDSHSPSAMRSDVSAVEAGARSDVRVGNRSRLHSQGRDALCCKQRKLFLNYAFASSDDDNVQTEITSTEWSSGQFQAETNDREYRYDIPSGFFVLVGKRFEANSLLSRRIFARKNEEKRSSSSRCSWRVRANQSEEYQESSPRGIEEKQVPRGE